MHNYVNDYFRHKDTSIYRKTINISRNLRKFNSLSKKNYSKAHDQTSRHKGSPLGLAMA
jgi:hypothetical protein